MMRSPHAQALPEEKADAYWGGTGEDIPVIEVAGVTIHLYRLGADLAPWLLALSARLAEFAATVAADGTRAAAPPVAATWGNSANGANV